jgi:hypothetical protein
MELIARALVEGAPAVRADLGTDPDVAQDAEGAARSCPTPQIEVQCPLALPSEMEAARRVEECGQLGEPVALPSRNDPRELFPDVLGCQSRTPSSSSKRRLTRTPAEP